LLAEQKIANSSAYNVGFEASALKSIDDLARVIIDIIFANGMVLRAEYGGSRQFRSFWGE
jgi:hypothetical protein